MIDTKQLEAFARGCIAAQADLKPYMGKKLEEVGEEFLDIVKAEIENAGNVDFGLLEASFTRYRPANIWELDLGALTLTVGTRVEYAKWVDQGHPQQPGRFVPGIFEGKKFRYVEGAKTGIVLKASSVKGSHYFSKSAAVLRKLFPQAMEKSFEEFFRRYFP